MHRQQPPIYVAVGTTAAPPIDTGHVPAYDGVTSGVRCLADEARSAEASFRFIRSGSLGSAAEDAHISRRLLHKVR